MGKTLKMGMLVLGIMTVILLTGKGPAQEKEGFKLTNLGPNVNSADSDFGAVVSPDGEHLFFTSDRETPESRGGQDIWVSDLLKDPKRGVFAWQPARNLGPEINTKFNEGPDCINASNDLFFFTRCDKVDDERKCDIYMANWDKINLKWSNVQNLGPNINSKYNDSNSSLSRDEDILYFVSDRPRPGAKPRTYDIYYSKKKDGVWQKAELLPDLNTPDNEFHVVVDIEGKWLYFSSDGYPQLGIGYADIFRSRIEGEHFGKPEFLLLYNTEVNDMYYSEDVNNFVYLASTRSDPEALGMEDIYWARKPPELQEQNFYILWGIVADRTTCAPPKTDPATGMALYDIETCTPISGAVVRLTEFPTDELKMEKVTGPDGKYQVAVLTGHEYTVTATAPNYTFSSLRVAVPLDQKEREIVRHLLLEPIKPAKTFVLNNIYFDFDKATLRPESKTELNNAIRWLQENPTVRVEVGGHTDSKGSDEYNIRLSLRRAQAVVDYLVAGGIVPSRLEARGYGERMPIASNATDEGRQLNRRVEFKILEY